MDFNHNLPSPVGWITRGLAYGFGLFVIIGMLMSVGKGRLAGNTQLCLEEAGKPGSAKKSALANAQALGGCIESKNGPLENTLIGPTRKMLKALPHASCKFVGRWKSSKTATGYEISLHGNGDFSARPWSDREFTEIIAGSWGVYDNHLVWFYNEGTVWPPDVNRMLVTGPNSFTLTEMNGSKTDFLRFDALPPENCAP